MSKFPLDFEAVVYYNGNSSRSRLKFPQLQLSGVRSVYHRFEHSPEKGEPVGNTEKEEGHFSVAFSHTVVCLWML